MTNDSENKGYQPEDIQQDYDTATEDFITMDSYDNDDSVENTKPAKKLGWLRELYEWTQAIAIAVIVALLINQFLFAIVQVEGDSMLPTLHDQERLIVTKLLYKPKQHDIVIVKSEVLGKHIVKRVIAVPGQIVNIDPTTGDVYVDGELQNEPYIKEKIKASRIGAKYDYPFEVPEDTVFVMGDNRNNSQDSRSIGVVSYDEIVGKASLRIFPIAKIGALYDNLPEE